MYTLEGNQEGLITYGVGGRYQLSASGLELPQDLRFWRAVGSAASCLRSRPWAAQEAPEVLSSGVLENDRGWVWGVCEGLNMRSGLPAVNNIFPLCRYSRDTT